MTRWFYLFVISFLIHFSATPQVNYTTKDGLPSNHVYRITQDHNGFIWIITDKGISKFDGHSFKNFTIKNGLPTNDIWNIRITDDNKVWFFYKGNELGYIEDDVVYTFPTENDDIIYPVRILTDGKTIKVDTEKNLIELKDSIWTSTKKDFDGNIYKGQVSDQVQFLNTNFKPHTFSILNNRNDTLYSFAIDTTSVFKVQQLNKNIFSKSSSYGLVFIDVDAENGVLNNIKTIANDTPIGNARTHFVNGELQSTGNQNLRRFDADFNIIETIDIPKIYNSHFSFKDNDGFLWLATFGNGIYKLPLNFKPESQLTTLPISLIKSLGKDTFVFSNEEGIFRLENSTLRPYFKGKQDYFDIYGDANDTLINSLKFIYRKNKNQIKPYEKKYTIGDNKYFLYFDNKLFSYGYTSASQHNTKTFESKYLYENLSLRELYRYKDTLFSFSRNKVMYFDKINDTFKDYNLEKPFNHQITTIFDTDNRMTILGIEDKGLWQFKDRCFTKLAKGDMGYITTLKKDNGDFWGIDNGILVKYSKDDATYIKTKFPYINGIKEDDLKAIHIQGFHLYLGSNKGLKRVSKKDFETPTSSAFYIKKFQINQQDVNSISYTYTNDKNISLDIGLLDFFTEDRNTFEYRLTPTQSEWIASSTGNISFFDLPPGNYTLSIRCQDNLDIKPLEIPISITPRWNQRLWFKIVLGLLLISLAVGLGMWLSKTRNKNRNLKIIKEKELAQLQLEALRSQMNPHFVFNSLNAIQYFINQNDTETSDSYLVKFSRLIRQFFELSKEQDITVKDEITLLDNYLELEQLRFKDKLSYTIIPPSDNADLTLKIPTMLIQPIVENSVNHGIFNKDISGKITVVFKRISVDTMEVSVTDDGVGVSSTTTRKNKKYTSKNLIQNRLHHLNTSGRWTISHSTTEVFPNTNYPGHKVIFKIKSNL